MNNILSLNNISHAFTAAHGEHISILKEFSFSLKECETCSLTGPSGSGKTTLLHIAGLIEQPQQGSIKIKDTDCLAFKSDQEKSLFRGKNIGFVFQFHHLLPEMTALENVIIPQLLQGSSHKNALKRSISLLEKMNIGHRKDHLPSELSGGEQQRVAIARALANKPALILADEPTGNLDPSLSNHVFQELIEFVKSEGTGALIATHDLELAKTTDHNLSPW